MPTKIEKDALSGRETTGHDWDGIRELNTPLPKWWLYVLYATVVWAIALVILYPAIPLWWTHTAGMLGYTTRAALDIEIKDAQARQAPLLDKIAQLSPAEIRKDPNLLPVALVHGRTVFASNCTPCHGTAGSGRPGYPNLADDVWLWGGTLDAIQQTITHGVRSGDPQTRDSQMPNFGADKILTEEQIGQVADYVWALWRGTKPAADSPAAALFSDNCAMCHGAAGEGNRDVGAPPLAAATHLYGSDRATIIRQITKPRHGVMPAWGARLDTATIKSLTLYVHSLGGGE
jgi:cytochrome c oxidase cbb3-type subunit 3